MIKYKVAWEEDPVDIKYLEDRYYWGDYEDYETFTHWMLEHEKDGSVKEFDALDDEEVKDIKEIADKMMELYTQLDSILSRADVSVIENIGEEYVIRYVNIFGALMKIRNNAHKFGRYH